MHDTIACVGKPRAGAAPHLELAAFELSVFDSGNRSDATIVISNSSYSALQGLGGVLSLVALAVV